MRPTGNATEPSAAEPAPNARLEADCALCGRVPVRVRSFRYAFKGRFLYGVSCSRCSLTFVYPQPSLEEIEEMYQEEYFTENTDEVGAHGPRAYMEMAEESGSERHRSARRLAARIRRATGRQGDLLEIGCGPGFFLAELGTLGWKVRGLELSEFAANHARDILGLDVVQGGVQAKVFPPESFDAIFLGDVLEHLPAPLESLRIVRSWLKPGGAAAIAVPSTLNLISARLGMALYGATGKWKTLRIPPYHLFEYTPRTLRRMLEAADLRIAELDQSAVPIARMGLRGAPWENAGKVALQLVAQATSKTANFGG
ncbi:MAG: class I SAM-dependent methyltransferase, partial [Candidatus Eisenbacteria bacterium]|nr:class I SAM-dependent methyltransferase [Candidatus Eisenbacteria bacterium]